MHDSNSSKDGNETNPQITKTLKCQLKIDTGLDDEYKKYCFLLGFQPNKKGFFGVERKFWIYKK